MNRPNPTIPLFLFAKAPIAGKVKTRLQTHCSAQQAADIAKILIEEAVKNCVVAWPGEVTLSAGLSHEDDFLQSIAQRYSLDLVFQSEGDLGEKMHNTFEEFGYPAAIMGCDAPHVLPSSLKQAYVFLRENKNVIAPSADGGYYFIGLTRSCPSLFDGVAWGSDAVYAQTLANAEQQSLQHQPLQILNDVDTWQDVLAVAKHLPSLERYIMDKRLMSV